MLLPTSKTKTDLIWLSSQLNPRTILLPPQCHMFRSPAKFLLMSIQSAPPLHQKHHAYTYFSGILEFSSCQPFPTWSCWVLPPPYNHFKPLSRGLWVRSLPPHLPRNHLFYITATLARRSVQCKLRKRKYFLIYNEKLMGFVFLPFNVRQY